MDEKIIDLADVLRRIQGDKELLIELVEIFLNDTPQRFQDTARLIEKADFVELADVAHSIKGAASNIGAIKIWQSFKALEEAAKQKDLPQVHHLFQRACAEFDELKGYFPQLKSQLTA